MTIEAPPQPQTDPARLVAALRSEKRRWFGLLVALALLLFVAICVLTIANGEMSVSVALSSFAASLGASALWWLLFSRAAEQQLSALLRSEIAIERGDLDTLREEQLALLRAELHEAAKERDDAVEKLKTELFTLRAAGDDVPEEIYSGKHGHDLRFNRDLDGDLEASDTYRFVGLSGIYVAARLMLRRRARKLDLVQVKLIDPTCEAALRFAVKDRRRRQRHAPKHEATVTQELRDDVFMAVVALFDARIHARRIRVMHEQRQLGVRIEMLDEHVYHQDIETDEPADFPRTMRWRRKQQTFVRLEVEVGREDAHSVAVTFRPDDDEEVLHRHVRLLGFDPARIADLRARYLGVYVARLERTLRAARVFREEMPPEPHEPH